MSPDPRFFRQLYSFLCAANSSSSSLQPDIDHTNLGLKQLVRFHHRVSCSLGRLVSAAGEFASTTGWCVTLLLIKPEINRARYLPSIHSQRATSNDHCRAEARIDRFNARPVNTPRVLRPFGVASNRRERSPIDVHVGDGSFVTGAGLQRVQPCPLNPDCVAKLGRFYRRGSSVSFCHGPCFAPGIGHFGINAGFATYAAHAGAANGGGRARNLARRRRFCAVAVSSTSSLAPLKPRSRSRSSRRMRFM